MENEAGQHQIANDEKEDKNFDIFMESFDILPIMPGPKGKAYVLNLINILNAAKLQFRKESQIATINEIIFDLQQIQT